MNDSTICPALVSHLAQRVRPGKPQVYGAEAMACLRQYPWPGNIRELANLVERLAILGGEVIGAEEIRVVLPEGRGDGAGLRRPGAPTPLPAEGAPLTDALDDYERELIGAALKTADGNVAEAARLLVTDRANLYRRMKRLGLVARGEPIA